MNKTILKALQVVIVTSMFLVSGFFAPANTVSAASGCGAGSYYDNNQQRCVVCPIGPYGISICPDTSIIFDENGELQTGNLVILSALFMAGAVVFLNSKYLVSKYE